jgi:hypothetical protein
VAVGNFGASGGALTGFNRTLHKASAEIPRQSDFEASEGVVPFDAVIFGGVAGVEELFKKPGGSGGGGGTLALGVIILGGD